MQINGLKFLSDKGWTAESTYQSDNGKVYPVPANHKIVATDESGDIVNLTIITPAPLTFKPSEALKPLTLRGNVSHSPFGWSLKASF